MTENELESLTHSEWLEKHSSELQRDYGGYWILVKKNKVIFADKAFDLVYNKANELCEQAECVIDRIDPGDGIIYAIDIQKNTRVC